MTAGDHEKLKCTRPCPPTCLGRRALLWFRLDRYTGNVEGTMTEHKSQVSIFSLVSTKADAFTAMQYEGGC